MFSVNYRPTESGFGGWADEKVETARQAAPLLSRERIQSTTFDPVLSDQHPVVGLISNAVNTSRLTISVIPAKAGIQEIHCLA